MRSEGLSDSVGNGVHRRHRYHAHVGYQSRLFAAVREVDRGCGGLDCSTPKGRSARCSRPPTVGWRPALEVCCAGPTALRLSSSRGSQTAADRRRLASPALPMRWSSRVGANCAAHAAPAGRRGPARLPVLRSDGWASAGRLGIGRRIVSGGFLSLGLRFGGRGPACRSGAASGGSAFAAFGAPAELSELDLLPEGDGSSAWAIPPPNPTATQADSKNAATINRNHQ